MCCRTGCCGEWGRVADNLKSVIRDCLSRPGRPGHVVGAGIGMRCRDGHGGTEPTLAILVRKQVSREEIRSAVLRRGGKELPFDVLEVGEVVALGKMGFTAL